MHEVDVFIGSGRRGKWDSFTQGSLPPELVHTLLPVRKDPIGPFLDGIRENEGGRKPLSRRLPVGLWVRRVERGTNGPLVRPTVSVVRV